MIRSFLLTLALVPSSLAQTPVDVTPAAVDLVRAFALDPTDARHLVCESAGSVYESHDDGSSWSVVAGLPPAGSKLVAFDADGALLVGASSSFTSSPGSLQRRTATGFMDVALPVQLGVAFNERLRGVVCHPVDPNVMALNLGGIVSGSIFSERVVATLDGGATWFEVAARTHPSFDPFYGVLATRFVATPDGGRLLLWDLYSDSSTWRRWVRLVRLDPLDDELVLNPGEQSNADVRAPRTAPGTLLGWRQYGPGFTPGSILERDASGTWSPIHAASTVAHMACSHIDPQLVVATGVDGVGCIGVSRDGGVSWTTLADFAGTPFDCFQLEHDLDLSSDDSYGYGRVRVSNPQTRLLRMELETPLSTPECSGTVNSTGRAGQLVAVGVAAASENRLHLGVRHLPAGASFLPLVARDAGFTPSPGGSDGDLCLGSPIGRANDAVGMATPWGEGHAQLDVTRLPRPSTTAAALAGETWRFQVWYRDTASPGASNLTGSIAMTFE
ncbi:MAG: hypothetical protein AAFU73_19095 [Planctomycetota bacterium]